MSAAEVPPKEPPSHETWFGEGDGEHAFDPYYHFAVDTGFRFIRGAATAPLPILIELTKPLSSLLAQGGHAVALFLELVDIPDMYVEPPKHLEKMRYITGLARSEFFERLAEGAFNAIVLRFQLCAPLPKLDLIAAGSKPSAAGPASAAAAQRTRSQLAQGAPLAQGGGPAPLPAKDKPVVVGIIDDAIAFAHVRFQFVDGGSARKTRFHEIWCQDLGGDQPYGKYIKRADIDQLLVACTPPAGPVDEDRLYRTAGLNFQSTGHKSWARRAGHGTHVLDLMAGMAPDDVKADSPVIAAVQLPVPVTEETRGVLLTAYALDGMQRIFKGMEKVAAANNASSLPCVINMSYGTLDGPHDGTGHLAEAIDERLEAYESAGQRVAVVLPAGNGHLSQCHAQVALPADPTKEKTLHWRILPDTRTPNFLEIWLPAIAAKKTVEVRVTTPTGHTTPWISEGDPRHCWPSKATPLLWIRHRGKRPKGRRQVILIAVFPTAPMLPDDPVAASGVYSITLRNVGNVPLGLDAWIGRNDTPAGYAIRGRQSRFEEAHYVNTRYRGNGRPEEEDDGRSYVVRYGSLNGLATGKHTIVVGSVSRDDLSSAPYSAAGPTVAPEVGKPRPRAGPDAMTIADHSRVRAGLLAAGMRSTSSVAMRGTSVSAPQLARFVADQFAQGKAGTRDTVAAEAQQQEDALDNGGSIEPAGPYKPAPSEFRGGSGRMLMPDDYLPPANRRR